MFELDEEPSSPPDHSNRHLKASSSHTVTNSSAAVTMHGSGRSTTTLQDVLEDEPTDVPTTANTVWGATARPPRMGSSVPMNIPFLPKKPSQEDKQEDEEEQEQVQYPGTMIQPHQLSQHGFMFSLTGASPSAAKRDRLRARNAILKSTGFLENQSPVMPLQDKASRIPSIAGGLSQALHTAQ